MEFLTGRSKLYVCMTTAQSREMEIHCCKSYTMPEITRYRYII